MNQCMHDNPSFRKQVKKIKENLTFSKKSFDKKEKQTVSIKDSQKGMKSNAWSRGTHAYSIPTRSSSKKKPYEFGYPTYFVSEDYHFTDQTHNHNEGMNLVPNRTPTRQAAYLREQHEAKVRNPNHEPAPFGRLESRHLLPKPQEKHIN